MLGVFYFSVLLAVFVSLQLVQAQITNDQAAMVLAIYKQYGCSSDASNARIMQAVECQIAINNEFYKTNMRSLDGPCASFLKDTSEDPKIRFCRTLKGPNDQNSIELIKCLLTNAGRVPDANKAKGVDQCVAIPPAT